MCENKTVSPISNVVEVDFLTRKIELDVGETGYTIKAEGYGEDFLLNLVSKLRGESVEANIVHKPSYTAPQAPTAILNSQVEHSVVEEEKHVEEAPTALNTGNNIASKLGEKAKDLYSTAGVVQQESNTDYYHTGIKYDTGVPRYRCSYECPKCGESGRHYLPLHVKRVSCHKCNTPLVVEPATENGIGETEEYRDANGNYLFAEVIDYTVATFDKSGKF